jgi:hypothetical protein
VNALLVFVPALGAAALHGPVLIFDLLRPLKRPLDFGARFRGRRLFGDNKTIRGALVMCAGAIVAALLLSLWPAYWHALPDDAQQASPALLGFLVGLGVVIGELPNSFAKRQLGVAPGRRASGPAGLALTLYDQADFVPWVVIFLQPVYAMPIEWAVAAFFVVAAVHFGINLIAYATGARETLV